LSLRSTTAGGLAAICAIALSLLAHASVEPDLAAGERLYNRCVGCHSPERNRTGPLHCGLFGRTSGTVSEFRYSDAMRNAAVVWDEHTLDEFLKAPLEMVPGTSMGFAGISSAEERRDLIAWMGHMTESKTCFAHHQRKKNRKGAPHD